MIYVGHPALYNTPIAYPRASSVTGASLVLARDQDVPRDDILVQRVRSSFNNYFRTSRIQRDWCPQAPFRHARGAGVRPPVVGHRLRRRKVAFFGIHFADMIGWWSL